MPERPLKKTAWSMEISYDKNGFPVFPSKFDTVIDDSLLKNGDRGSHFKAANEAIAKELKDDPKLAKEMGLTKQQVDHILKEPPSSKSPPGLTWHHHQDVGKMQLVDRKVHDKFRHTGGFSIWGK
jgi:type VI secretion system secreted protein VgrG